MEGNLSCILFFLSSDEEARFQKAARQEGLDREAIARKIVNERSPLMLPSEEEDPTLALFARWDQEDSRMTPEEREKNVRIYAEIEKSGVPRIRI